MEFANDACYIGISGSDCASRLIAHGKTYDDITGFRLQRFAGSYSALRDRERSLIHDAEKSGLVVRNREHALRFEDELPHGASRCAIYLRRRGIRRGKIKHAPGGASQQQLIARGHKAIETMTEDPVIMRAAASLNLALMRKGRSSQIRSHCAQLARAALDATVLDPA
ncbi:hypothetical protein [Rhodococcus sp. 105337]|uniref:hypothetical protein n=1 Tax=Rhodococcus sp. 105337 TaxID=2725310 RepID=UPI00146A5EA6|nr:hypothetical protein [Rhodococcus sp. 105337]